MAPIPNFNLGELAGIAQRGEGAIIEDRTKIENGVRPVRSGHMQRRWADRAHGGNGAGLIGDSRPFNFCHVCMSKA